MNADAIKEMAAQLEVATRAEDARFRLEQFIGGDDPLKTRIVANRVGFLRLAAWLMRGAVGEENVTSSQFSDFDNEYSEHFFDDLVRREEWSEAPLEDAPLSVKQRVSLFLEGVGCWLFGAVVLFLVVAGLMTVFGWVFG